MKLTNILFVAIIALLLVTFFQCKKIKDIGALPPKVDTVIKNIEIHDTVPGKPKLIKILETDTVFYPKVEYVPHPNYDTLLAQYEELIKKHFVKNIYETRFPVKYGVATVTDTVHGNKLVGNNLMLDFIIPEKHITVFQPLPVERNFYLGTLITGGKKEFVNSVNVGGLYKDKKDRIFGASIGYNGAGHIQYGFSSFIKIK